MSPGRLGSFYAMRRVLLSANVSLRKPSFGGRKAGFVGWVAFLISGIWFGSLVLFFQVAEARIGMRAPEIISPVWINSTPQSRNSLHGKVVLVEFWTFGCFNCRNVEPQIKRWHEKYAAQGLAVIGIHSPEFSFEKDVEAVRQYVKEHAIEYAVAVDNDFANWKRFRNRYWPTMYLVDKQGVIRHIQIGEGGYAETERVIQALLAEKP